MASNYFGGLIMKSISKEASKNEVKNFLASFTDEDFNGNNGKDYYIEINHKGEKELVSRLDACMYDFEKYDSLKKFIPYVLKSNYENDSYYTDYQYEMMEFGDNLVLSLSTQYCN